MQWAGKRGSYFHLSSEWNCVKTCWAWREISAVARQHSQRTSEDYFGNSCDSLQHYQFHLFSMVLFCFSQKSITGSSFTSSDSVDAVSSPPAPNLNRVLISSLSSAAKSYSQNSRRAFVLKFPGDIMASKVNRCRINLLLRLLLTANKISLIR